MKFSQYLLRAGVSLLIALIISYSLAIVFFNFSNYQSGLDRTFLVMLPALAIAFLLYKAAPAIPSLWRERRPDLLRFLALLALLSAALFTSRFVLSPIYLLGLISVALVSFLLMLPVVPAAQRVRRSRSMWHYFLGFLLSLVVVYGVVGFLSATLKTTLEMVLFTFVLMILGSLAGYYLVRHAAQSFRTGFLRNPLNVILCLLLPAFLIALILVSSQFPEMFLLSYISTPPNQTGYFAASALVAGVLGIAALEQFESRGLYQRLSETKFFAFIKDNLPGIYAGSFFFLINLIIARALNHPALSVNTVLFETDAGPWMVILGSPESDAINRSVHPLVLILARPLIRFVALFTGDQWQLAGMITVAALSGLCVFMAWLFVKRATAANTYAFIFAALLGSTTTHLFFGSLTETYVFGMSSLILFFLLLQLGEKRFSVLVPAGILTFGITISNLAQTAIGLFFTKFGFWRVVRFCLYVVSVGIALTVFTNVLYPGKQTFFFVPADIAFETNFVRGASHVPAQSLFGRSQYVARTMLLYGVIGPRPIEDVSHKDPAPTIDLKTFNAREGTYASYIGLANVPLALWLLLLAGSVIFFLKDLRSTPHLPLMLGLLGSLAFNFLLHMVYGTELFLYTPYWTYALVLFLALAFAGLAGRKWFEACLTFFLVTLMTNNLSFIFLVLRGLAHFYIAS